MINKNTPLVLSNLYAYDFSSCVYNLLKNLGWDVSNINSEDKYERNLKIGLMRRDNPSLSVYLEESMERLIDYYLNINNIEEDDVILRQKDGVVLSKNLQILDKTMPLDFRGIISRFIFSLDRRKWLIIYNTGEVEIKGVKNNLYDKSVFDLFKKLNYTSKTELANSLEGMRRLIFSNGKKSWHVLEEEGEYIVPIKNTGYIKLRQSTIASLSLDDIEKRYLWEDYIWVFVESLFVYCCGR